MVTPKQTPQPNSPEKANLIDVRAADERYIEEVAEGYRLRDLRQNPPPYR